jgi:hypothetical protein
VSKWLRNVGSFLRNHWRVLLRDTLLGLAALVVLYFASVTVLLKTGLLRRLLNGNPDKLLVEYRSASMIWPGRVHLEGLYVRNHDDNVEWQLRLDTADVRIELWPLLQRRFHALRVRGQGVSFRARQRLEPAQIVGKGQDLVAALPEIQGYATPPMRQPPAPHVTDEHYALWTVHLEDVDVGHVREVWIDGQNYTDDGRARGAFMLRPGRRLWVGPATFEARSGELHYLRDAMALDVRGLIELRIDELDPRTAPGSTIFGYFTVRSDLEARLPNVAWLRRYLPAGAPTFEGGGADGHLAFRLERGMLVPGTHVTLPMKRLTVADGAWSAAADVALDLKVLDPAGPDPKPTALLSLGISDLALRHRYAEVWPARSEYVGVLAKSSRLEMLQEPFADLVVSVDVPNAKLSDLRALAVFVPKGDLVFAGGNAAASGHIDASLREGLVQGRVIVVAKSASVRWKKSELRGDVTLYGLLAKGNFDTFGGDLTGSYLDVTNVQVTGGGGGAPAWWGHVDVKSGSSNKGVFRSELALKIKDARPVFALLDAADETDLPGWARDLFSLDGLAGSARLTVTPGRIDVTDFVARGGGFIIEGDLRKHGPHTRGVLFAGASLWSLGLVAMDGGSKLTLLPKSGWFRAQTEESRKIW